MNLKTDSFLVGLLAGIASALLLLGAGQPSLLSIPLFAAAALPIFIAGLGWSNRASIVAVICAIAILAVQSAMWVIILFIAWYIAGLIVRQSGRAKHPRDHMLFMLRMPPAGIILFGIGMVLTFFSGPISYIGAAMVGGFGAGFMLAGLAWLHLKTVDKVWRHAALWFSYTAILLFSFPAVIFAAIGLFEAAKPTPMLVSHINKQTNE